MAKKDKLNAVVPTSANNTDNNNNNEGHGLWSAQLVALKRGTNRFSFLIRSDRLNFIPSLPPDVVSVLYQGPSVWLVSELTWGRDKKKNAFVHDL